MAALNSTVVSVAASATSVVLAAASGARRGLTVYNDSTSVLYLKYGPGASTSLFTVQVPGGGVYELPVVPLTPSEAVGGCYSGVVTGVWSSAVGAAMVTEVS